MMMSVLYVMVTWCLVKVDVHPCCAIWEMDIRPKFVRWSHMYACVAACGSE